MSISLCVGLETPPGSDVDPTQVGGRPTVRREGVPGRMQSTGRGNELEGRLTTQLALAATWTQDSLSSRKDICKKETDRQKEARQYLGYSPVSAEASMEENGNRPSQRL